MLQKSRALAVAGLGWLSFAANSAFAAIDEAKVKAGLDAAQSSGESVGGLVIGCVAALAAVGLILALVRKV